MRQETDSVSTLRRHRAQCQICRHPDCAEIEQEFLDWTTPREIAETYHLGSYRTVYRHAHALGLFEARGATLRFALDRLIEHVSQVTPTAAVVLAAIRLAHQIDQKQQRHNEDNGHSKTAPFILSLAGLPRTNAVTGRAPEAEPYDPNAVGYEPWPAPAPAPAPAPSLPAGTRTPPSARPAQTPVRENAEQPAVSGFVLPWSKRKKPFSSPSP